MTSLTRNLRTTKPMRTVFRQLSLSRPMDMLTTTKTRSSRIRKLVELEIVCATSSHGLQLISCLVAGRTILNTILHTLQRITFDEDPLRLLLLETSYQPFISLFHMLELVNEHPQLAAIRECSTSGNLTATRYLHHYSEPCICTCLWDSSWTSTWTSRIPPHQVQERDQRRIPDLSCFRSPRRHSGNRILVSPRGKFCARRVWLPLISFPELCYLEPKTMGICVWNP